MKKKALRKDFFMEIKGSLNRFLSIFLIVALGVAFFAGIRATDPDMRITADSYYDENRLMDIRVLSTLGLTEEDVKAISEVDGVETVEPAYSTDVLCKANSNELVLQVLSFTKELNYYTVKDGRLPEKADEILVDTRFIDTTGYKLGDKIKLASGTEEPLSKTLNRDEFTIVGVGTTPSYLSFQRGNSDIGNGEINSFIVTLPEVFSMEAYTTVYVSVKGARELTAYTKEYDDRVSEVVNNIKAIADKQCQNRYDKLYNEANDKITKARQDLDSQRAKAEAEMNLSLTKLQNSGLSELQLQASMKALNDQKVEAEKKFTEAEQEIADSEDKLSQIDKPTWYVLDRSSIEAYVEFEQNADRIGAIGEVFPAIFFLVAALISLTTMTRMVEEERIQIGTLKALGYSKIAIAMKYMLYALLASLGGSLMGAAIGLKLMPTVIITAYKILYRGIPRVVTPYNTYYAVLATAIAVITVGTATFFACYKELLAKPAQLMRPEAPKAGKRVLLERFPFIWKRLNFTWKATVRNLLRYKKRFFMTIFGIGGCMALLLVGYGLKDSIFVIYSRQFSQIMLYDASVSVESKASAEQIADLEAKMKAAPEITSWTKVKDGTVDISFDGKSKSLTMYVPEDVSKFEEFFVFRSRIGHIKYALGDDGVILTEQAAKKLGVKAGDTITIKEGDITANAKVTAITENYLTHFLYMSPGLYQNLYGKVPEYNEYFLLMPNSEDNAQMQVGNSLLEQPAASGVFYVSYFRNLLSNVLVSLNIVVWVLIIAAGALAFIVLYNLNNININERRRELATIKVLGFYNKELAAYVYRENMVLTVIGILFGIVFGIILHYFVIVTVEIDLVMFGRNIDPSSFIYSIFLTFLFSAAVNFVMYYRLKKINMVESLKSVE